MLRRVVGEQSEKMKDERDDAFSDPRRNYAMFNGTRR